MTILVAGGAGFIGSNFVLDWLARHDETVVNLDKLTYAGNPDNLADLEGDERHYFITGDLNDRALIEWLLNEHNPRAILNFAAESHVDRSIHGSEDFIQTNIVGVFHLLEAVRVRMSSLSADDRDTFRLLHISTDEVYGTLEADDPPFTEAHGYAPNSPYSASKAASDHLIRAWHYTYGLPVLTANCSNNYGPCQFPEKLIPLTIFNALTGRPLPIYGDGLQIRDWLYVRDHCRALQCILENGRSGSTYNIGGWNELTNIEAVRMICTRLDELRPRNDGRSYTNQITHVPDRAGHDRRYAIDTRKIEKELGWQPEETFESGLDKTIRWYLKHGEWLDHVTNGDYRDWVDRHYTACSLHP